MGRHCAGKKNKGFTLSELLATIAILCIMMAIAIPSIIFWRQSATFKHNNDAAKTLYTVLQAELTERKANNTLDEAKELLTGGANGEISGTLDSYLPSIVTEKVSAPTYETIYTGYEGSANKGPIYYLKGTAKDWEDYCSGTTMDARTKLLYDLLSEYLFKSDYGILAGSVCIEIDPTEGLVYSVFYCKDEEAELNYDANAEYSLLNRTKQSRKKNGLVGYYGVDYLSVATSVITEKPVIKNVMLNNEETLNLTFSLDLHPATELLTYEIYVYDADTNQKLLRIRMNRILEGAQYQLGRLSKLSQHSALLADCEVTKYGEGETVAGIEIMTFPAWIDEDAKVTLILDAVDFNAASKSAQENYKNYLGSQSAFVDGLENTFSIYRLGIENSDRIYCTVQGTGGNYNTTAVKKSNTENRAFFSSKTANHSFTIANARHLYNIRFEETAASKGTYEYTYKLGADFSWSDLTAVKKVDDFDIGYVYGINPATLSTGLAGGTVGSWAKTAKAEQSDILAQPDETGKVAFPSIPVLREKSSFTSEILSWHKISDLYINSEKNNYWGVKIEETGKGNNGGGNGKGNGNNGNGNNGGGNQTETVSGTGLFMLSEGNISKVTLEDITVKGEDCVGAFCGLNGGTVSDLKVSASSVGASTVEGNKEVGGIFGSLCIEDEKDGTRNFTNLTNEASVSGKKFVGGIAGCFAANNKVPQVTLENCINTGAVFSNDETDCFFIGGITGFAVDGSNQNKGSNKINIKNCHSSPRYSQSEEELLKDYLKGYCVGGIVGFAFNANIVDCSTKVSGVSGESYVVGDRYVGGIAGLYVGKETLGANNTSKRGVNAANVFGNDYVGGIVGCNSSLKVKVRNKEVEIEGWFNSETSQGKNWYINLNPADIVIVSDPTYTLRVENWENRGRVIAQNSYAGGITGYNTGFVYNCISSVENKNGSYGKAGGDYAGGIVGYNNGIVGNTPYTVNKKGDLIRGESGKPLSVVCYASGKNYVGGIVGYNDVNAVLEDYTVTGGTVLGFGSFVGGYAGVNCSVKLLNDGENKPINILSNPNMVEGKYCVGGVIGGNILYDEKDINIFFNVDNFLGEIKSEAVAGGFIGYATIVPEPTGQKAKEDPLKVKQTALREYIDDLASELSDVEYNSVNEDNGQNRLFEILNTEFAEPGKVQSRIIISPAEGKASTVRVKEIEGYILVGGVIGYSADEMKLEIRNITSKIPVTANGTVSAEAVKFIPKSAATDDDVFYSFAGGITGYIGKNVTVENCQNADIGNVRSDGTFTGGLCEVNMGTVKNCFVSNVGDNFVSRVGGICGINFKDITDCAYKKGATVSGKNFVGGIVSENYGTVSFSDDANFQTALKNADFRVKASGDYAGGIAGYNGKTEKTVNEVKEEYVGTIKFENAGVKVDAESGGKYLGGLVGRNKDGLILMNGDGEELMKNCSVKGSVLGADKVGGVIGELDGASTVSGLMNEATVTASAGTAAGIAGETTETSTLSDCLNIGTVNSAKGDAAGTVGVNGGKISKCANFANVSAPKGSTGGICAVNKGGAVVSDCVSGKPDEYMSKWMQDIAISGDVLISALKNVGGIAAENYGTVENCRIGAITISNMQNSGSDSAVGGFVDENFGELKLSAVSESTATATVKTYSTGSAVGGVVGKNSGTVTGADSTARARAAITTAKFGGITVSVGGAVSYANIGGIAGINTEKGSIKNIEAKTFFDDSTKGLLGASDFGFGGISGANRGVIENCAYNGAIIAAGNSANVVNLGGIAGKNFAGAEIENCRLGNSAASEIKATNYGYVGGITGWNCGTVLSCNNYPGESQPTVYITNSKGQTGGIVGYQYYGAAVYGTEEAPLTTGANWTVTGEQYSNDCGTGGIIGYSCSGNAGIKIEYVKNYAKVENKADSQSGNSAVGGFIGRLENNESGNLTFANCENYGEITGKVRVGGMVGCIKYMGANFENCVNKGKVSGKYAGGIVGMPYSLSSGAVIRMLGCENLGEIEGTDSAGGMMGVDSDSGSSNTALFTDCVNNGAISGKIVGGMVGKVNASDYFYRCRNYGTVENNGPGMTSAYKEMVDCFDFRTSGSNLTDAFGTIVDSYYYSGSLDENETAVLNEYYSIKNSISDSITASINVVSGDNLTDGQFGDAFNNSDPSSYDSTTSHLFDGDETTLWTLKTNFESSGENPAVLKVECDKDITDIWLSFGPRSIDEANKESGNSFRRATFKVYYQDTNGNKTYINGGQEYSNSGAFSNDTIYISAGVNGVNTYYIEITNLQYKNKAADEWSSGTMLTLREIYFNERAKLKNIAEGMKNKVSEAHSTEYSTKKGLPLSVYTNGGGSLLSSYYIWGGISNPVFEIGIQISGDPATSSDYYNLLEKGNGSNTLIDQYYIDKYASISNTEVAGLSLNLSGGVLYASWNRNSGAYGYKIVITDENGEVLKTSDICYQTAWNTAVPSEWYGKTVTVKVRGVSSEEWTGEGWKEEAEGTKYTEQEIKIKKTLPTPEVYLELGAYTSDGAGAYDQYVAVLKNTADYDMVLEPGETATIKVNADGNSGLSWTIVYEKGKPMSSHSKESLEVNYDQDDIKRLAAYAEATEKNSQSLTSTKWVLMYGAKEGQTLKTEQIVKTTFKGMTGNLPEDLSVNIEHGIGDVVQNKVNVYVSSELIAQRVITDEDGTKYAVDAVVSGGISNKTVDENTHSVVLGDLPEDLLELDDPERGGSRRFTVRTYIWSGQSNVVYYGHVVAKDLGESELINLTDGQHGNAPVFAVNGTTLELNPGYVLYRNTDRSGAATYEVRYSAILANPAYATQVSSCTYTYNVNEYNADGTIKLTASVTNGVDSNNAAGIRPVPKNLAYAGIDPETKGYSFTWAADSNSAEEYQLKLYGVAEDGRSVLLKTVTVDRNSKDDGGNNCYTDGGWKYTFTDAGGSWRYTKMTLRVTRAGENNGSGVCTVWPYYNEVTANVKTRYSSIAAPTLIVPSDKNTMDYSLSWTAIPEAERTDDFLCYEITVEDSAPASESYTPRETATYYVYKSADGSAFPSRNLIQKADLGANNLTSDPTIAGAVIAFDAFEGCTVNIRVHALAAEEGIEYSDGGDGVNLEAELASRLKKPDLSNMTMSPAYDENDFVTAESIIESGLKLTMTDDSTTEAEVKYEVKLYIYSEVGENGEDGALLYTVDMEKVSDGRFMDGELNRAEYKIGNELETEDGNTIRLSELAGKYLYVALRSTSENAISSYWTNESDKGESTTEYAKFRIPRIKLAAPALENGFLDVKYNLNGSSIDKIEAEQRAVSLSIDPAAKGYVFHITEDYESDSSSNNVTQRRGYELTAVKDGTGFTVKAGSAELAPFSVNELNALSAVDQESISGLLDSGSLYKLPYEKTVTASGNYVTISAWLHIGSDGRINLILPDNDAVSGGAIGTAGTWTRNVTVQAFADASDSNYIDSDCVYQMREANNNISTGTVELGELPTADSAGISLSLSRLEPESEGGIAIQANLSATGGNIYRIMMRVETVDGKIDEYSMCAEDNGGIIHTLYLENVSWEDVGKIKVRLIDATTGHFGGWTQVAIPDEIKQISAEILEAMEIAEVTQKTVVWNFDSAAAGYLMTFTALGESRYEIYAEKAETGYELTVKTEAGWSAIEADERGGYDFDIFAAEEAGANIYGYLTVDGDGTMWLTLSSIYAAEAEESEQNGVLELRILEIPFPKYGFGEYGSESFIFYGSRFATVSYEY